VYNDFINFRKHIMTRYIKVILESHADLLQFEEDLNERDQFFFGFNASSCISDAETVEELEANEDEDIGDTAILLEADYSDWDHLVFTLGYLKSTYEGMLLEFLSN
jgi:hypothetical protein